jgi:hypothetical protein
MRIARPTLIGRYWIIRLISLIFKQDFCFPEVRCKFGQDEKLSAILRLIFFFSESALSVASRDSDWHIESRPMRRGTSLMGHTPDTAAGLTGM